MNTCDIIIPTKDGKEKLRIMLPALREQEVPSGWSMRLIVSDDGSKEPIADFLNTFVWSNPWAPPVILRSSHKGRAHARNSAITSATANVVLFLADDMVLCPNALREHLLFHTEHSDIADAALGCVLWDPRIHPTPFMEWMMHGGQQNDYDSITGVSTCSASHYFYGSFVSLKREFLGEERFDNSFSEYGWEDLELGNRLEQKGLKLHVLHGARALHHHKYLAGEILQRQRIVGSAKYLVNTNATRRVVHGLYGAVGARAFARYCMQKWGNTVNLPRFFALVTAGEYWYGVHHANKLLKSEIK